MDFLLPTHSLVIEVKRIRDKAHAARVGTELTVDIEHYHRHPDCARLWCAVYDPRMLIRNRRAWFRTWSTAALHLMGFFLFASWWCRGQRDLITLCAIGSSPCQPPGNVARRIQKHERTHHLGPLGRCKLLTRWAFEYLDQTRFTD